MRAKILVLLFVLVASGSVYSQGIEFEHGTFSEALAKAKKENKLLFMDCYTKWCGPCKLLAKNVFTKDEVGSFFNKHFIALKMDMETPEGKELAKSYQVPGYPTLFFLDGNGDVVHKIVGSVEADKLLEEANVAIKPAERYSGMKTTFEEGNRNYDFLIKYFEVLSLSGDRNNMKIVSRELIKRFTLEKFMNKELVDVLVEAQFPYKSSEYEVLLQNEANIKSWAPYKYQEVFLTPIKDYLNGVAASVSNLNELLKEVKLCCNNIEALNEERELAYYTAEYYLANDDLLQWFDLKLNAIEKDSQGYLFQKFQVGLDVLRNDKLKADEEIIKRTFQLANEIYEQEQGVTIGNLLLAKLYLLTKEKAKALKHYNAYYELNHAHGRIRVPQDIKQLKEGIDSL